MEFLQPLFFAIITFSQFTVIITSIIFCAKLLKSPKKNENQPTQSMASRGSVGPDGKPLTQPTPSATGAAPTTPETKKPDEAAAAGAKQSEEKKPDEAPTGSGTKKPDEKKPDAETPKSGVKKSEKKDDPPKKNDIDQSKGKQKKEDEGDGEGYENCNEMTPSQLAKIANEVK
uniref:Uncharacterized protein n=1 Tax=Panagrolaimus sp. PS1159 TaxID=55785 RepID=A0AC35F3H7_9BILA